ncbi:MAG: hypothetical protein JNL28_16185 [Planctomycetes bacterium]|nr:hypothetical protein [Planctomycetota bacterium]
MNRLRLFAFVIAVSMAAVALFYLFRAPVAPTPTNPHSATLIRERVAAFLAKDLRSQARAELAPLIERSDPAAEDLVRAAAIEVSDGQTEQALAHLAHAEKIAPDNASIAYLRGQLAREAGDSAAAVVHLRRARALAPHDLPTAILLGAVEDDLEHPAEAEKLYREVVAAGFENGQTWYYAAVTRLANLLTQVGRDADAEPLRAVIFDLEKRGLRAPTALEFLLGELGRVKPPAATGSVVARGAAPKFEARALVLPETAGYAGLLARDIDGDGQVDLLAYGERGIVVALRRGATYAVTALAVPVTHGVCTFDADNDGDLDLLVPRGTQCALYENQAGVFAEVQADFPPLLPDLRDIIAVDYDHEGDLDLVLVGGFGARMWRRDGTDKLSGEAARAVFTDVTQESALPTGRPIEWCVTEDFDGDNDVDILFGLEGGLYLADSLRGGLFTEIENAFGNTVAARPIVADLDGDARADLWVAGSPSTFVPRVGERRASVAANPARKGECVTADFDLDGALDLAWIDADGTLHLVLAPGHAAERAVATGLAAEGSLCAGDFDGDGRTDLAALQKDGVHVFANAGPVGHGVNVSFEGNRDNRRGVGAVLEFRAGDIYRRIYWRGEPTVVGIGPHTQFDVLRATWPNGVGVTDLDVALDTRNEDGSSFFIPLEQPSGQIGSCPFLYTWNGTTYTFVTDVLGITPLGLPIAPGMLVPPDHDEYVLVKGEQMVAKDGVFEMQFTEELREVTYLDHARLIVLDHPNDTEVFPNERFTFPPFPEAHTHTMKAPLAPSSARASDGRDWQAELAHIDDKYAVPFTLQAPQFAGLAQPWFVELAFDPAAVAASQKLRLVMTGWFFWSDASANMAAARNPTTPFIPPILQVPDGKGGWRDTGPPVGFPAGKTKTMVIDVSDIIDKSDPQIRVFTSMRLYWDALRLAVDDDDAPLVTQELACTSAQLWRRGFSAPLDPKLAPGMADPHDQPERFDWDVLAPAPRWNQHPGLYTRLGECRELLDTVDDRFVILGAGDALTLRFDAAGLGSPAAGMRRDYLVYLDGWAKDRDPNTVEALAVEPLPFHAMSGYPYRADEHFPADAAHEQWRKEWNTRPDWRWVRPISPARESEWLLSIPALR